VLEGLDRIDWASLRHAYGPATDVPQLIRDLASDDYPTRRDARSKLHSNIWHQGTIYQASAYAVPFLIVLAGDDTVHERDQILALLAVIASGSSFLDVHQSYLDAADSDSPEFGSRVQQELGWVRAAHDAVAAGIPTFLKLVRDADPDVGACAAYALSCFPERATQVGPPLRAALDGVVAAEAKASAVLCLGCVTDTDPVYARLFEALLDSNEASLVRLAAAMALARAWRVVDPERAADVLERTVDDPGWDAPPYPWAEVMRSSDAGHFEALETAVRRRGIGADWNPDEYVYYYVCAP
jgi:hypothetical protein